MAALAATALLALGSCGNDDEPDATTTTTTSTTSTTVADSTTTTEPSAAGQPAIWPATDVVLTSPEEAAEDFVTSVLGVPATLGEFEEGDARSGEMEVLSPGEGAAATPVVRSRLLLRQLGPDGGWFVLAAVSGNATITEPASAAEVPAGPLAVEGRARGFEATVVVSAFVPGDAGVQLDQVVTTGGAQETPEPYTASLDLSGASPGDVVAVLVRGGTGLETDPGDFGAVPVVITG